ncbi:MAG: ComEA family DNA-binding protein [Tissierellia bacterium]|nr:ComEA family DNA-binding protein [Tissierellia bacterium]
MNYFTKKEQLVIMFLILIIIVISLFSFFAKKNLKLGEDDLDTINPEDLLRELDKNTEGEDSLDEENNIIMVHISGEVHMPGLVELAQGSRVIDAVKLAGGLKNDADMDRINLAKKLLDEEKIYIPKIGEENTLIEVLSESTVEDSGKINLNTATKEQLMTLPGIGEVLAGRIIDYRENTPFKSITDIKNVSGIGDKKFEGIEDLIITR